MEIPPGVVDGPFDMGCSRRHSLIELRFNGALTGLSVPKIVPFKPLCAYSKRPYRELVRPHKSHGLADSTSQPILITPGANSSSIVQFELDL